MLFRTISAFPSSKKENSTKSLSTYTASLWGKKKEKKWGCGGVSDAVKKLHRQLIGNSRSISGKPGERQETIFSILHWKGSPCEFCTWRRSKSKDYLVSQRHCMQLWPLQRTTKGGDELYKSKVCFSWGHAAFPNKKILSAFCCLGSKHLRWWDLEVLCRQLIQGFAVYWQEDLFCSIPKISYLALRFQVANPHVMFSVFIYFPSNRRTQIL